MSILPSGSAALLRPPASHIKAELLSAFAVRFLPLAVACPGATSINDEVAFSLDGNGFNFFLQLQSAAAKDAPLNPAQRKRMGTNSMATLTDILRNSSIEREGGSVTIVGLDIRKLCKFSE